MSSGVSDRLKRQAVSGKHVEECDAIPWSQQVDEASYENLSSPTDNKGSGLSASVQFQNPPFIIRSEISSNEKKAYLNDPKIKCYKPYYCTDSKRSEDSCAERKKNVSNASYNTKKDNVHISQKMSSRETHKVVFGSASGSRNEDHKTTSYSPVDNSSMSSDSNLNKKKITWASIASQPAKPSKKNSNILLKKKGPGMPPPPMIPGKHNLDINAWEFASNVPSPETCESIPISIPVSESANAIEDDGPAQCCRPSSVEHQSFSRKQPNVYCNKPSKNVKTNSRKLDISRDQRYIQKNSEEQNQNSRQANMNCISNYKEIIDSECNERDTCENRNIFLNDESLESEAIDLSHIVLKKLKDRNNYNPAEIDMQNAALSRFFVIKSYSEDDIHRSIKYEIWCSTDHGNKRLDEAFKERVKLGGNVMLFFSVNGSGHFCGMAQMMTSVDYNSTSSVWSQDKWKGKFKVKWIYVKDVPNSQLRHIRLENNDNKSVTNSRDTQEVPSGKGLQVLRILHLYKHQTSIFDDFYHYEKKQEEAVSKKPIHIDNYVHPSSSSNLCSSDAKEKEQNSDRFSGNFRDRIVSPRGGHHNILGNRRYGKNIDTQPGKDGKMKSTNCLNQDREDNESDTQSLQRHKNICPENCSSSNPKRNFNDIILHMNNFNCNENKTVGENSETKLS